MTTENLREAPSVIDPNQGMGEALVALQKRAKFIQSLKVAAVWIVLIILVTAGMLMLHISPAYMAQHYDVILQGLWTTIYVSLLSIGIATVLALLGSVARLSSNSIAQGVSGFYVSLIRGTPLLIQIYVIYLGLPQIGQRISELGFPGIGKLFILDAVPAGILALSLNYGAYMTEIFRAGLQSISYGQREAAIALGMTPWQVMRRVILPQAIRIIIPDVGNQFIAMQKDSALVSVMGVWETTFIANRYARRDSKYMEMFIIAATAYWILTIVSSWLQGRLEKRLAHAYER